MGSGLSSCPHMTARFGSSSNGHRLMQGTLLSGKLLTALLAALMVWPSWAMRDCCCTRRAAQAEMPSCCQRPAAEPVKKLSPCCAARAKATPQQQASCQRTSTCRCRVAVIAVALPKSVQTPRAVHFAGPAWAESPDHAAESRTLSSTAARSYLSASSGSDGPTEICIRLCRWLA